MSVHKVKEKIDCSLTSKFNVCCTCSWSSSTHRPAGRYNKAKSTLLVETKNGSTEKLTTVCSLSVVLPLVKDKYCNKTTVYFLTVSVQYSLTKISQRQLNITITVCLNLP